jgi:hypothetical protein
VWATPRDHDGIGNQIQVPANQVSTDARQSLESSRRGPIDWSRSSGSVVLQECRPHIFTRTHANRVGMLSGLVRQRRDVQPAEHHVRAFLPVMVGYLIGAVRRCDVDLDYDEVRLIVEIEDFNVFILQGDLIVSAEISCECSKPQWRKEGVLDRTEERARGLRQCWQDQLDTHGHRSVVVLAVHSREVLYNPKWAAVK